MKIGRNEEGGGPPLCPLCSKKLTWSTVSAFINTYKCPTCGAEFQGNWETNAILAWIYNPKPQPKQKARLDLVPPSAVYAMAEALTYGADKHGEHNWRQKEISVSKRIGSALRHIQKFLAYHDIDEESGVHHLGCAMASLAVVHEYLKLNPDKDDRFPLKKHTLTDTYQQ